MLSLVIPLGDLKPQAPFEDPLRKRHARVIRGCTPFACLFFFQLEIKQIGMVKRSPKKYVYLFQQQLFSNTSETPGINLKQVDWLHSLRVNAVQKMQKMSESPVTSHVVAKICANACTNREITEKCHKPVLPLH